MEDEPGLVMKKRDGKENNATEEGSQSGALFIAVCCIFCWFS
jgi:hypothetical protein